MFALHIHNKVNDYEQWKSGFDAYDGFRREHGVQSYRISRHAADPRLVCVDLDFATRDEAAGFLTRLETVLRTPRSQALLESHEQPELFDVTEARQLR
ncbi:hypothetical protein [Amycolatopsis echigonensis]|uniref:Cyclase n=1 Tax=Amycolatopsis echigonensis TaxID=2576905 RepID=A0A8E2AZA0_9PSEU|nr:hypothetical protein [Amycolatopsis echigonensis]MBB2498719.1 hypothetical protein [Amycolatopsis echigonensis]